MMEELSTQSQREIASKILAYLSDLLNMIEDKIKLSLKTGREAWFWQGNKRDTALNEVEKIRSLVAPLFSKGYPIILQGKPQ